ncbi:hypothetical protein LADH09A_001901 [Micromonospora sp. LAH09]|uniref:hypothetical protein n=1 Tax=Micromonospora cabrerizensis TaxID=2911213 RepID=UPI001EE80E87|nr:hypothetical protein [Micromonospora cabrerizensis]MCG5468044.1 hypothetical protein [Micromonospora cabrerizensis]
MRDAELGTGHAQGVSPVIEQELPRSVWVPMLAQQTVAQHDARGSCERCRPQGCQALSWARDRLEVYRVAGNRRHGQ